MSEPDEEFSKGQKIAGFSLSFIVSVILTAIALPLLLDAMCVPANMWGVPWLSGMHVFVAYLVVAIAIAGFMVARTENPGVRAGCITAVVALIIAIIVITW